MAKNSSPSIKTTEITPLVSVIIPVYNRENLLKEALESVVAQSYIKWEALVIDDVSEDDSQNVAKLLAKQDERIRVFERHRSPKGANTCRNIGIEKARGEFVVFLDSDDLLAPFCLEQRITYYLANLQYDFVVFPQLFFEKKPFDLDLLINVSTEEHPLYRFLTLDTVWLTSQPIWKIQSIKKIQGFDENLNSWQDLDLHLRALKYGLKFIHNSSMTPDCFWRINHQGRITDPSKVIIHIPSKKKVIELGLSFQEINCFDTSKVLEGVRILTTSIILNLLKAKKYNEAYNFLMDEGRKFKKLQKLKLIIVIMLHNIGAEKIKGFLRIRNSFLGVLYPRKRLWGKVKYQKVNSYSKVKNNDQ